MRKLIKILGIIIAIFVLILGSAEIVIRNGFDNSIRKKLLEAAAQNLESELVFSDLDISIIRDFPNVSVRVDSLLINDSGLDIVSADEIFLSFDLRELFNAGLTINKVKMQNGKYHFKVDTLGNKHMIRTKPKPEKAYSKINLNIPKIEISNSLIIVDNQYKRNKFCVAIDETELRLESSSEQVSLLGNAYGALDTVILKGNLIQTDIPIKAIGAAFRIGRLDKRNIFDGIIQLAEAQLQANGVLKPTGNGNLVDIVLATEQADLNDFISLFPAITDMGFSQLNPDAKISFRLRNTGFIDPTNFPFVHVDFELDNASFFRKGGLSKIDSVFFKGAYSNGISKNASTSEIIVDYGRAKVKDSFIELNGSMLNFDSPVLDVELNSEVYLSELKEIFDLPSFQNLDGVVEANFDLEGPLSELDKLHHGGHNKFRGEIEFINVEGSLNNNSYVVKELNGLVELKDQELLMKQFSGRLNGSGFKIQGGFENYAPLVNQKDERMAVGEIILSIDEFKFPTMSSSTQKEKKPLPIFNFPKQLLLNVKLRSNQFDFDEFSFEKVNMSMNMKKDSIVLRGLDFKFEDGSVLLTGKSHFKNGINVKNEIDVDADLQSLNLDKWLKKDTTKKEQKKVHVPDNLYVKTDIKINEVYYKNELFDNFSFLSNYGDQLLSIDHFNLGFAYGDFKSSWIIDIDSIVSLDGNMNLDLTSFEIDSLKQYVKLFGVNKKEKKGPIVIEDLDINITSPSITYNKVQIKDFHSSMVLFDKNMRLKQASFDLFGGSVDISALLERDSVLNTFAKASFNAENINMKKLVSSMGDSSETFNEEHFRGAIDIKGGMVLKFDPEMIHQEQDMIAKISLDLQGGELIKFKPITESLKFLKQTTTDTIYVANRNIEVLIHNDEIVVPSTTFTTNLSNIEFVSYYSDELKFNFNSKVSVRELLFKSQKKKKAQIGASKAKVSGMNYYLSGRTVDNKLNFSTLKRTTYSKQKKQVKQRYRKVDSTMVAIENQMLLHDRQYNSIVIQ